MILHIAEELKLKRKKELKRDNASKIKAMVDEVSLCSSVDFFTYTWRIANDESSVEVNSKLEFWRIETNDPVLMKLKWE